MEYNLTVKIDSQIGKFYAGFAVRYILHVLALIC